MDTAQNTNCKMEENERKILEFLGSQEKGYGFRKWAIAEKTGIDLKTVSECLINLRNKGEVELVSTFSEWTGFLSGSGYHSLEINP